MRPTTDVSVTTGARKATRISISGEDILMEILLRQPLKSLVRFRCVSKQWLSLIDGPYFSHRRYPNSNTDPPAALLLCPTARLRSPYREDQPQSIAEPPLVFSPINPHEPMITLSSLSFVNPSSPRFYICSSCNGLLLVAAATFPAEAQLQNYFVINPTTREFKKLPQLEYYSVGGGRKKDRSNIGMSLAFDPKSSISPDEFKVICIMRRTTNWYYEAEHTVYRISIYSSVTKEWKVSGSAGFASIHRNLKEVQLDWSVFCNGAIHWYSYSEQSLYLDVENGSLRIMDMPKLGSTRRIRYFGASRGRLHIIDNFCPHDGTKLKLYEMRSDYSGWVVKHQIQLEGVLAQFPYHSWSDANNFFCINSFVRWEQDDDHGREEEEEEEGGFLVVQIPHCQIRYNLKDGSYAKIFKLPPVADDWKFYDFIRYGWFDVFPYFASLARLN